jgi:mevalonate kinase
MEKQQFAAAGKLLFFGEYLVLRGSKCLSFPLKYQQTLTVSSQQHHEIHWTCLDENAACWLDIHFSSSLEIIQSSDEEKAKIAQRLLQLICEKNPTLKCAGLNLEFRLNFNRMYGFGTSSTLLSLLSQWSGVDAYYLLEHSFGGSGYDLATALSRQPIVYTMRDKTLQNVQLSPSISNQLLFIYLGAKQSSANEIANFKNKITTVEHINEMNAIVEKAIVCSTIEEWEKLMTASEQLLSTVLAIAPIQQRLFSDYPHSIKSLGAWGGDFIMASTRNKEEALAYFKNKGYTTIFSFDELIKSN